MPDPSSSDFRDHRTGSAPADELIEELEQQAAQLREQATELETLNEALRASEARLRGIIDSALDAIVTTDEKSVVLEWNHHAEQIFGWRTDEAMGRALTELIIPAQHREAHTRGVERYHATGEGPILNRRIEITALRRDGTEFPVELTVTPTRWGNRVMFSAFLRDLTEEKRAERHRAVQFEVTRVLAQSQSVDEALPALLAAVCQSLDWDVGVLWMIDPHGEMLRASHIWTAPSVQGRVQGRDFETISREVRFAPGVGLPGRVWSTGRAAWISDVTKDSNFPRSGAAARVGVHAAFAFPVRVGEEFLGAMEFFQRPIAEPDPALLLTMDALGSDVGQFLKRKQAEERLARSETVQRFLAETSMTLSARAVDYEAMLKSLARSAVPVLADWCTVYLVQEESAIERLEVAHADPEKEPLARELARYPVDPEGAHPAIRVIRTGEPVLLSEIPDELIEQVAQDKEHLRLIQALGLRSAMVVPLTARGRTLGTVTLVAAESGRRFGEDDLQVAMEFARRAALAVDNARLYALSEEASQAKSDFMATMSHELRTPLTAVIGYAELLHMGVPAPIPEPAREQVERIQTAAQHQLTLIEEILTFSRLQAGSERVQSEPSDITHLTREAIALVRPRARKKGLPVDVDLPTEPLVVQTDPTKVRQILVSLLSNAVRFTREGEVRVSVEQSDEHVHVHVSDTGVGIAPEHREKIFEPFWQVNQGNTREVEGIGLGLAIARRTARLLGGDIEVESEPGAGATFTLVLPQEDRDEAKSAD